MVERHGPGPPSSGSTSKAEIFSQSQTALSEIQFGLDGLLLTLILMRDVGSKEEVQHIYFVGCYDRLSVAVIFNVIMYKLCRRPDQMSFQELKARDCKVCLLALGRL